MDGVDHVHGTEDDINDVTVDLHQSFATPGLRIELLGVLTSLLDVGDQAEDVPNDKIAS